MRPPIHYPTKPHCFLTQSASNPKASRTNVSERALRPARHRSYWCGHGMSFFGPTMGCYSSFQSHSTDDIRQIQSMETGVLFLSMSNLKCQTRGGLVMFDYLLLMTENNTMLMGGLQNYVLEFDLNTVQQTQKFTVEAPGVAIMQQSNRFLFCGNISGKARTTREAQGHSCFSYICHLLAFDDMDGNALPRASTRCHRLSEKAPTVSIQIFLTFFLSRRAPPVDPEILHTMKTVGFIGYIPNPRTRPRNQVCQSSTNSGVPESPIGRDEEPHLYMVHKKYRKVTIKYSKLGLEDFDFKHYNRTLFAGLEPHIPNAYCNCMIQVLYFLEPIRCLVQNHLRQKEFCLACELGFLFHMLDLSRGDPCQASNFLRAFQTIPEASALGLILADSDEQTGKVTLGHLIQSWNRFILTQLHQETQEQEGPQAYRGASSR
uniref:Poly(A) specific ribonuclease subunit PAN2 n=1 Tax=Oncorhynchus mykiss TaxID=8022 RepID=A0A8C7QXX1_ONCMY